VPMGGCSTGILNLSLTSLLLAVACWLPLSIQVGYLMLLLCGKPCLEHIHNVNLLIVNVIGVGTHGTVASDESFHCFDLRGIPVSIIRIHKYYTR
jgi:hypothetical protein